MSNYRAAFLLFALLSLTFSCRILQKSATAKGNMDVIAYYSGNGDDLQRYRFDQLTQVIFSFLHLRGERLTIDNPGDSLTLRRLVALKQQHPKLKILVSLGGWGGCETCSPVFATAQGRKVFAESVREILNTYGADGIDLDWEYPGIEGYPGHAFVGTDREHFTALVQELRHTLGKKAEINFAAGGFPQFFDYSVDWAKVMPLVNRVNVMTYDLVNGFSTVTGHHTPLYSNPQQALSVNAAVRYLDSLGVPKQKIAIGAAFYARVWENVDPLNNGLYQSGKFKQYVSYNQFGRYLRKEEGFVFYRDPVSQAPYAYSAALRQFATFDDAISMSKKTAYARDTGLGGIMFWELSGDADKNGLLQAIDSTRNAH